MTAYEPALIADKFYFGCGCIEVVFKNGEKVWQKQCARHGG